MAIRQRWDIVRQVIVLATKCNESTIQILRRLCDTHGHGFI
jgi:hypothetical protein